jgi:hypothetical protein
LTAVVDHPSIQTGAPIQQHASVQPAAPLDRHLDDLLTSVYALAAILIASFGAAASTITHYALPRPIREIGKDHSSAVLPCGIAKPMPSIDFL